MQQTVQDKQQHPSEGNVHIIHMEYGHVRLSICFSFSLSLVVGCKEQEESAAGALRSSG